MNKPCPFCGKEPFQCPTALGRIICICVSCGVSMGIEFWNTRPIEDVLRAEWVQICDKLRRENDKLKGRTV